MSYLKTLYRTMCDAEEEMVSILENKGYTIEASGNNVSDGFGINIVGCYEDIFDKYRGNTISMHIRQEEHGPITHIHIDTCNVDSGINVLKSLPNNKEGK